MSRVVGFGKYTGRRVQHFDQCGCLYPTRSRFGSGEERDFAFEGVRKCCDKY